MSFSWLSLEHLSSFISKGGGGAPEENKRESWCGQSSPWDGEGNPVTLMERKRGERVTLAERSRDVSLSLLG